ncbi:hypothetical protein BD311DRAFT_389069 [Dichomitus squalens]|uniref:Pentatricopeptide repeat-containing protein-mitochondrial domain-containing protein n=1 Tax=Dichomitus squalens TaxID=114155 RepID=A0A4Q9MZR2_9APHY|nr:hypothetical protein BD311DRAFT_389069 [Dichomitus squalens]
MLASSSRHVLKGTQRKLLQAAAEVANAPVVAASSTQRLHEWRRHAGTAPYLTSTDLGPSYESPHRRFAVGADTNFRSPTNTPLARFNMMLASQLDRGKTHVVFTIARRMKAEGVQPDRSTYNCLLQACAQERLYAEARGIFEDMVAMGIHPDRQSFHYLMETLRPHEQSAIFDVIKMMEEWSVLPNEFTYESITTRLAENQRLELALQFLAKLGPAGLSPTLKTATAVITCAADLGFPQLALDLADSYESTSVRRLEPEVWVDLLVSCAESLYSEGTLRTWRKVVLDLDIVPDEGCCLQVLHTAARHGHTSLALEAIGALKKLNVVWAEHHFAPVVEAMCARSEIREAFILLDFMRKNGMTPTLDTASPILALISKDTDTVDEAWGKLEEIRENGEVVDPVALNVVIQAAVALKDLQRAVGTYKAAAQVGVKPNIDTFNLLLEGCIYARHRQLGDRLLSDLKNMGVKADVTTYKHMVLLCLTQTTYEDAFFYLEEMKALRMVPPLAVYEAIIRKLVSVGDTRYKVALEELKECGYEVSPKLESFISSGGAHNGPTKEKKPVVNPAVVL